MTYDLDTGHTGSSVDPIKVKFDSDSHRSNSIVTGWKNANL